MTDNHEENKIVRLTEQVGKYPPGTWALLRGYIDSLTVELAFEGDSKWHQAPATAIEFVPDQNMAHIVFGA